jgi:pilus assembly protein CpaF
MSEPATRRPTVPADVVGPEVLHAVRRRFREAPGPVHDAEVTLGELLRDAAPLLAPAVLAATARHLAADLVGLGAVERLLEDPEVTDVLVNGPGVVWVERRGRLESTAVVLDDAAVRRTVERMVAPLGVRADRTHPVVDARLADGTRVAAVLPPLAPGGTVLAVRRHRPRAVAVEELGGPEVGGALRRRLIERRNLVVYGATGAGKTTVVDALLRELPAGERVVVVEDVAELRAAHDHVVRLEARAGTADGVGRVAIRELVRAALRLRPDRIVVGEVRGAEALDMVWALSTGHRGSMSTVHAATPTDALARLDTFALLGDAALPYEAVRAQVRRAVDVLIGVARRPDGTRGVVALHDVADDGELHPFGPGR